MARQLDYKERFIALLDEMYEDEMAGLIPCMIAEGLNESKANNGDLGEWVVYHVKSLNNKRK